MRNLNKTSVFTTLSCGVAASIILASCTSKPPVQNTNVTVTVPSPTEEAAKSEGNAVVRDERGVAPEKPVVEIDENPEPDEAPAAKSAPASSSKTKPAPRAATSGGRSNKSELLWYYDRAPAEYFTAFGGVNRRSLLNRKGAIVDYKHRFIEIPGSANERDGDLHKLQMTLLPNGDEPWCAISRIVWPQGNTPGKLGFYNNSADSYGLRQSSDDFFPYQLRRVDGAYESAWLPQRGLDININSGQDSEFTGPTFRYSRDYSATKSAFSRVSED